VQHGNSAASLFHFMTCVAFLLSRMYV
jgi:hypothetical protein